MKMHNKIATAVFMLLTITSTTVTAADSANKKVLNPWTDCGIGGMIFTNTGWAAAISNIIWDLGTTAVTSNISSQNTCGSNNAKVAMFIGTTYANIEEETVKGGGQHVNTMLNILRCDPASHDNIIGAVRTQFSQSLLHDDYAQKTSLVKAEEYYNIVQAKVAGEFAQQCQIL